MTIDSLCWHRLEWSASGFNLLALSNIIINIICHYDNLWEVLEIKHIIYCVHGNFITTPAFIALYSIPLSSLFCLHPFYAWELRERVHLFVSMHVCGVLTQVQTSSPSLAREAGSSPGGHLFTPSVHTQIARHADWLPAVTWAPTAGSHWLELLWL